MQKNEFIVFDFDETLIRENTFTLWCKWLLKTSLTRLNFLFFFKLIIFFIQRKITKTLTHEMFKLKLITSVPCKYNQLFATYLCEKVHWNDELVAECREKITQNYVVVSSAAPEGYLNEVLIKVGIAPYKVIGCKVVGNTLVDNYKYYKAENLLKELKCLGRNKIDILYTDSLDDSYSMNISNTVYFIIYEEDHTYKINKDLFDAEIIFVNVKNNKSIN